MQGASEESGSQSSFLFLLHRILIMSSIPAAPERVGCGVHQLNDEGPDVDRQIRLGMGPIREELSKVTGLL